MFKLYGASDDLIEVEYEDDIGRGQSNETYLPNSDEPSYVALSNGMLVSISYNGEWTIKVRQNPNNIKYELWIADTEQAMKHTHMCDYTDVLVVDGDVHWTVVGVKV